ncbi:hypothetical protein [Magnetococcus sp. PR-3]|uniref:hypothetical protein n=1 Tax=Magnetococcus sp. PR-3 TaxID=3120355 RepID=UPI002FCE46D7
MIYWKKIVVLLKLTTASILIILFILSSVFILQICFHDEFSWYSARTCLAIDSCLDSGGMWVKKYERCCFAPYSGTERECLELIDQDPAAFPDNIEIQIEEERARFNMPRKSPALVTPSP